MLVVTVRNAPVSVDVVATIKPVILFMVLVLMAAQKDSKHNCAKVSLPELEIWLASMSFVEHKLITGLDKEHKTPLHTVPTEFKKRHSLFLSYPVLRQRLLLLDQNVSQVGCSAVDMSAHSQSPPSTTGPECSFLFTWYLCHIWDHSR